MSATTMIALFLIYCSTTEKQNHGAQSCTNTTTFKLRSYRDYNFQFSNNIEKNFDKAS